MSFINFLLYILIAKNHTSPSYYFSIIGSIIIIAGLLSCGSKPNGKNSSTESMVFRVDSTLLGTATQFPDYNLRLMPPRGWEKVDSVLFGRLSQLAQSSDSLLFRVQTLAIFADKQSGCLLSVLLLHSRYSPEKLLEQYIPSMKNKLPSQASIKNVTFTKEFLHITQFLVQTEQFVTFKLFITTPELRIIQCDYVIPVQYYTIETAKTIESSIGSILTLHTPS